jgi:putative ABC transport system permease protein
VALPLGYSLRNLRRRPWRTLLTVAGIAVVVFAAALMAALSRGVQLRLAATGEPANLLVISRKGQNLIFSSIEADELAQLSSLPGAARGPDGNPLVAHELMDVAPVAVEFAGRLARSPVNVRGVKPLAYQVHRCLRVTAGRLPEGPLEVLAGSAAHVRLGLPAEALAPGRRLRMYDQDWTVCGTFSAAGTLFESELWVDDAQLLTRLRRSTYSFAVARMAGPAEVAAALPLFRQSGAFEKFFRGWSEPAYYREYLESLSWIYWLSLAMAAAVTAAGALIGVNTMYTAVLNRVREMAMQRVLGFSRPDILKGLLAESLVMAALGGALGACAALALDGMQFKFSQGVFRLAVDGWVLGAGLVQAVLIGLVGALVPAAKGLRLTVIQALRYGRDA